MSRDKGYKRRWLREKSSKYSETRGDSGRSRSVITLGNCLTWKSEYLWLYDIR